MLWVESEKPEHGNRTLYAGFPSCFGLDLDDSNVPTLRLRLWIPGACSWLDTLRLQLPVAAGNVHYRCEDLNVRRTASIDSKHPEGASTQHLRFLAPLMAFRTSILSRSLGHLCARYRMR